MRIDVCVLYLLDVGCIYSWLYGDTPHRGIRVGQVPGGWTDDRPAQCGSFMLISAVQVRPNECPVVRQRRKSSSAFEFEG